MFVKKVPSLVLPQIYATPPEKNLRDVVKEIEKEHELTKKDLEEDEKVKKFNVVSWYKNKSNSGTKDNGEANKNDVSSLQGWTSRQRNQLYNDTHEGAFGDVLMNIGCDLVEQYFLDDIESKENFDLCGNIAQDSEMPQKVKTKLTTQLELSKKKNASYALAKKTCKICKFESDSHLVMASHYETPHRIGSKYFCNYCDFKANRSFQITQHVAAKHRSLSNLMISPQKSKLLDRQLKWEFYDHTPDANKKSEDIAEAQFAASSSIKNRKLSFEFKENLSPDPDNNQLTKATKTANLSSTSSMDSRPSTSFFKSLPNFANERDTVNFQRTLIIVSTPFGDHFVGYKNQLCEVCDCIIKDVKSLHLHMLKKHSTNFGYPDFNGYRLLACPDCPSKFINYLGLERHLIAMHNEVTVSFVKSAGELDDCGRCPLCSKVFFYKFLDHLKSYHNRTLTTINLLYSCYVCQENFGIYYDLVAHIKAKHNNAL